MSARKLGGGRILGSGRSLAPSSPLAHDRSMSLLSVSGSTVSSESSSPLPSSPLPETVQDLSSRVSLDTSNGGNTVTAASSKLQCPICNEEMVTLLQLNRHLDDNHQEIPEVQQEEVKSWFEKQVVKAKKFQPLAVINQKLKGLDVFESNDSQAHMPLHPSLPPPGARLSSPELVKPRDADEDVSRAHWQKSTHNDVCTEPACGKRLGSLNGSINCRKCGRLFCEEHTMYQMKLSKTAQHDPVRGAWCRVCETCYKSREGYNDHSGLTRDHTSEFLALRRKTVDRQYLEVSKLEKRLSKLTNLLANPPEEMSSNNSSLLNSVTGQSNQKKLLEQSVVAWEEDSKVARCPFCQQEFGSWSLRRHHCRLCGRVVCSDPKTACSTEVGLNATGRNSSTPVGLDIRMCRDCRTTIFSKKDFEDEISKKPPDQRAYENLLQFEKGIRILLANFQKSLLFLQDPEHPPSHDKLAEAAKVRKRLIDSFGKYDLAAKRLRDLPTSSATQLRLQKAIYQQASSFLHLHMLPLKSLPKLLKHASPHGMNGLPGSRNGGALASIKFNDMETASQASSSSAVSAMEAEEKELRERLIVLEEQKFFVSEMIADANKRRKFDEVTSLAINMEDLSKEIDSINGMLSQLDFAGAYTQGPAGFGATSR